MLNISISPGNSKTGKIPSISLPPGITCTPAARRSCFVQGCYAQKIARIYPTARASWQRNLDAYRDDPADYFYQVSQYIEMKTPKFFRWHISGDVPDKTYHQGMIAIASRFPNVKFLCFTKTAFLTGPDNLRMVRSAWPGLELRGIVPAPIAWMYDAKAPDPRIPTDARPCPGRCDTCGLCWSLRPGESVVFDKH